MTEQLNNDLFCVVGIDPGIKGGIAWFTPANRTMKAQSMPIRSKEVDLARLHSLLKSLVDTNKIVHVFIEKVHSMPKQGVASTFVFGRRYGEILGIVASLGLIPNLVIPQTWKRKILAGTAKDKQAAIDYCKNTYASVNLMASSRCRTPSDGIADAVCICSYGIYTISN